MKRSVIWVAGVVLLAGCQQAVEAPVAPMTVLVRTAAVSPLAAESVLAGEVRARHEADLSFQVGGKLLERRVDVGSLVRKGEVLARLDPTDVNLALRAARAAQAAAQADLALARAELERARGLRERNFISASALETRQAALAAAQARFDQTRAQAQVSGNQADYAVLMADADGVVTAALAEVGQVLGPGQGVVRVARRGEREILIHVPEGRRNGVSLGAEVEVRPWADGARRYPGKVRELAPAADPLTRTFAARVSVAGGDDALPLGGTAVVVFVGPDREGILLPLPALTRQGGHPVVWVVDGQGVVNPRAVEVAAYRADGVVVQAGLAAGEQVVVAGVHKLVPGQTVRSVGESAPVVLDVMR